MKFVAAVVLASVLTSPAFADLIVTRGTLGVEHFTNDGTPLGTLIAPGTGGLSDARGVAVSSSGRIFVADFANDNILQFSPTGGFLGVFAGGVSVDTPFGLAFNSTGDLLVASGGPTSNIARLDGNTGAVLNPSFTSGNVTPLGGPQHLTFGPTLAVTDFAGHVFRFNPSTGAWISTGLFDNPQGVAFNAAGELFVAQRISNNVVKIPAGGGLSSEVIPNGDFAGSPAALAIGPDGLLYLAATSAIYRFDVSGPNGILVDSFGDGGIFLAFTPAVPEPATWALAIAGLLIRLPRVRPRKRT